MPIPPVVLGALAATALKGIFDSVAVGRANRYNSPRMQLKRLRQAGLPQAYMYSGRVNQQSDVPELSIDPDFGVSETQQLGLGQQKVDISEEHLKIALQKLGIDWEKLALEGRKTGAYERSVGVSEGKLAVDRAMYALRSRLTDAQIEKLGEEIRFQRAGADIKEGEAAWLKKLGKSGLSNQETNLQTAQAIMQADLFIKQNEGRLKKIFADIQDATKFSQIGNIQLEAEKKAVEIKKLLAETLTVEQLQRIRGLDELLNQEVVDIMKNGDATVSLYALLVQIFREAL